jgi:secondary thiamine-phosphate synthase enzyme
MIGTRTLDRKLRYPSRAVPALAGSASGHERWQDGGSMLRNVSGTLRFRTTGSGLLEITEEVRGWLASQGITSGLLTLFCRHTSASLLIQENAASAVRRDLERFFAALAPEDPRRYEHDDEGPDDMPGHLRAALTAVQLTIPVGEGRMALGTWQGIYLFEHRHRAHEREIALHFIGE